MTQGEEWLREALGTHQGLTPFVGTGVSLAVTANAPCAGWKGLLESGIEATEKAIPRLKGAWGDQTKQRLNDPNADIFEFLNIGDLISQRLKNVPGRKAFPSWIKDSVGKLEPKGRGAELIQAIRELAGGGVIATTNYDNLLEAVLPPWEPYDWDQKGFAGAARQSHVVLHLHGSAANPDSIILGSTDYQRRESPLNEVLSRSLFVEHTLVFIGCGTGLNDPHIEPVLSFLEQALGGDEGGHYILLTNAEDREFSDHPLSQKITSIAYGDTYPELLPFLRQVTAGRETAPAGHSPPGSGTAQSETGTLSVAIVAQQKLRSALDGMQRVRDELSEVESHLAISDAIGKWEYPKQAAEHAKVAASLTEPSERLDNECQLALPRVKDAVDSTWPLALPSYASQAGELGPIYAAAAELATQSADSLARAGQASDILSDRVEQVGSNYEEPASRLAHAYAILRKAQRMAGSLHEGLSGPRTGGQPAAPPVTPAPDPEPPAAAPQPASEPGRHLAAVVGRVSASGIIRGIGLPTEEWVPIPPRYAQRQGIYAVQVDGDSMTAAGVLDGDYLTVLPSNDGDDGEMVVAVFGGESDAGGVVKWLRRPEGSPPYLESPDPADTENLRRAGEFQIQGKVIGVVRWSIRRLS